MRLKHFIDRDGEPITLDGCECDEGFRCHDAECQMSYAQDARYFEQLYRKGPSDPEPQAYWDSLRDAQLEEADNRVKAMKEGAFA